MIDLWRQATPSDRLSAIFRTGFAGPAFGFQVASNLALGVLLFLLAWTVFDWCTREEKDAAPTRRWLLRRTTRRSRIPPRLVGTRAISWKDFTFISGGKFGLLVKFGVLAFLVALCNFIALEFGTGTNITREFEGTVLIWVSLVITAVCLALEAAHVFREEIRWKTLSSLVTLPVSVPELAYRKVAGTLAGTLPLLAGFVLGVVLVPEDVGKFLDDILKEPIAFGMFTVAVLQFILFLHLTAFLSLIIKRGALPLAIAIQYLGGSFFMTFLAIPFRRDAQANGTMQYNGRNHTNQSGKEADSAGIMPPPAGKNYRHPVSGRVIFHDVFGDNSFGWRRHRSRRYLLLYRTDLYGFDRCIASCHWPAHRPRAAAEE